nr:CGNR zinc finger domain-containing protein [Coralloluteibacterium stylophorae]
MLAEADLQHVRACEAHDCTLLFQDTTRSHRRRWCSMAACGNRMKAAAFRARSRDGSGRPGG